MFLENEGEGNHFSGRDPVKISNSRISVFAEKVARLQYFAKLFCNVLLFDVTYHNYHVWMEIVLQIQSYRSISDFG